MIDLPEVHDIAMEVLCSIPPEPAFVVRSDLIDDFFPSDERREATQKITAIVDGSKATIATGTRDNRQVLFIPAQKWPIVKAKCEDYWATTHMGVTGAAIPA